MAEREDVKYKRNYLDTIGKLILNNKQYSEITFVVNKKHYHASRIIMSASSEVLKQHLNNVADKEIILQDIQHNESFFHILQYIHGVEINLTKMSKLVLCEILHLSERYKLREMHTDIKCYFSKIKRFKMNSVVTMMNTAKKYELTVLYARLKIYVFLHTEDVIKHKSFVDFQFDVLEDLLKSDWLYAKEIDILRAALSWHDENIMDVQTEVNTEAEEETESEGNVDELTDDDIDSETDESWSDIDLVEEFLSNYSEDLFDFDEHVDVQNENTIAEDQSALTGENIKSEMDKTIEENIVPDGDNNKANPDIGIQIDKTEDNIESMPDITDGNKTCTAKSEQEVVETFSMRIMKMLLCHIRFSNISMFEYSRVKKTKLFMKYEDQLFKEENNPKLNNEPRRKHEGIITKKFTVKNINKDMENMVDIYSKEEVNVKNFTWKVSAYPYRDILEKNKSPDLAVILKGQCDKKEWECDLCFQITLVSKDHFVKDVQSNFNDSKFAKFCNEKGIWDFVSYPTLFNPDNGYVCDDTITLEVSFVSMVPKTKCELCNV